MRITELRYLIKLKFSYNLATIVTKITYGRIRESKEKSKINKMVNFGKMNHGIMNEYNAMQ